MNEKKSWVEIMIMPLVVAIVGIVGTSLITNQQIKNAETQKAAQLEASKQMADADRQIKILEIVSEKLTSENPAHIETGLRLLSAIDAELAEKVARAVLGGEPDESAVRRVAEQAIGEGAFRSETKKLLDTSGSIALENSIVGKYLMDNRPDRIIMITELRDSVYRIEEPSSPWPWEGEAVLQGTKLLGKASFRNSEAVMRVEGLIRKDGSIAIKYNFITGSTGSPAEGRVDHHVWYPT